jgi:hypothetical protein
MSKLSEQEISALLQALDDEYRAWTTYSQVIEDFGEVRPFINIRAAEARHIEALLGLFRRHGVAAPANPWAGRVKHYRTVSDACADAVESEIANAALYDHLMASMNRLDLLAVFHNLREASKERHLPAFQRCIGRHA